MPATRSPTGQYVRTRRPMPASACLEVVAEAAQHLELEVLRSPRSASAWAIERTLWEAIAGADERSRVDAAGVVRRSKLRSLSTLASKTGGVQPFWRASTVSCSQ